MSEIIKRDLIMVTKDGVDYVVTTEGELLKMANPTREAVKVTIP